MRHPTRGLRAGLREGEPVLAARVGDERRAAYEKRIRNEVEAIVSSVVGQGRARVQLSADFDYNKVTQTSDKYDPEGRVLRSSQTREESSATAENNGQVTVNNELPGQQRNDGTTAAREQSKKSEETNNYEISRTTKTEVTEAGRVNRISVAVLVDATLVRMLLVPALLKSAAVALASVTSSLKVIV